MTPEQEAAIRARFAKDGIWYQADMGLVLEALDAERDKVRQLEARMVMLRESLDWAIIWLDKYPWPSDDHDLRDVAAENIEHIRTLLREEQA